MLTELSKVPAEPKKKDFFPAKYPIDARREVVAGGTPSKYGRGPDLTACMVGLRSHLRSHQGPCSTRTGPKYVGS